MDWTFILLSILYFFCCSLYSILGPFFPSIAKEKGMSQTLIGILFSLFALIGFVSSPIMGKIMIKIGKRNILLVGGIIECGGMILFALIEEFQDTDFIIFSFLARILMGLGGSVVFVTVMAIVSHLYSQNVEQKLGSLQGLGGIGFLTGPLIGGGIYYLAGYKAVFFSYTFTFLVLVLLVYFILKDSLKKSEKKEKVSFSRFLKYSNLNIALIAVGIGMAGSSLIEPILSNYLKDQFDLNGSIIAIFFAIPIAGYSFTVKFQYSITKNLNRKLVVYMGLIFQIISFSILGIFQEEILKNEYIAGIGLFLLGCGSALTFIPSFPLMKNAVQGKISDVNEQVITDNLSTLLGTAHYCGESIGPALGGILVDFLGFSYGTGVFAGFVLFSVFLIIVISLCLEIAKKRKSYIILLNEDQVERSEKNLLPQPESVQSNNIIQCRGN